jgi:proteasome lid subunit RPN8/RPN11
MKETFADIAAHARACYPGECCGFIFAEPDGAFRFVPIPNIAGTRAGEGDRTVRDGYVMDPKSQLRALQESEDRGASLHTIVHSHPDVGAYFSREDRHMALGGETEPLWPGVRYLVVSVRKATVDGAKLYTWDAVHRDFREEDCPEISAY